MSTWHYYDQALFFYDMARSRNYEPFLEHLAHDVANVAQSLESGVLSPIAITINLIIVYASNPSTPIDFSPVVFQVAGIAPTLVIARARAGKSFESIDHTITTLQFTMHQHVEDPTESTSRQLQRVSVSIGGLHRVQDEAGSNTSENWSGNPSKDE
uniref:Uncharacterized protein n=1 Tax=Moniliophthora roreri TaxID=221103 RepID=A0A0W0F127_MONRR